MAKAPWRFQGDIAYGDNDPTVIVFMGEVKPRLDAEGDETGEMMVEQNTNNPVTMKLSELKKAIHLADPEVMGALAVKQKAVRVERRKAEAEVAARAAPVVDEKAE